MVVEYEVIFEPGPLGLGLRGQNPIGEGVVVYEFGDKVVEIGGQRVTEGRYTVDEVNKIIKGLRSIGTSNLAICFSTEVPAELALQQALRRFGTLSPVTSTN
jgi:hypothetical protein